jgi:hypothetical protein
VWVWEKCSRGGPASGPASRLARRAAVLLPLGAPAATLAPPTRPAAAPPPPPPPSRIVLGRDELLAAARDDPSQLSGVAALDVRGNFMFDPATHRDFLGALVGTGARPGRARARQVGVGVSARASRAAFWAAALERRGRAPGLAATPFAPPLAREPPAAPPHPHSTAPKGIVRDRVGDVLVQGEGGAQVLVDAELAEHFEAELTKARRRWGVRVCALFSCRVCGCLCMRACLRGRSARLRVRG